MLNTNLSFPAYTVDKLSMKFIFLVYCSGLGPSPSIDFSSRACSFFSVRWTYRKFMLCLFLQIERVERQRGHRQRCPIPPRRQTGRLKRREGGRGGGGGGRGEWSRAATQHITTTGHKQSVCAKDPASRTHTLSQQRGKFVSYFKKLN